MSIGARQLGMVHRPSWGITIWGSGQVYIHLGVGSTKAGLVSLRNCLARIEKGDSLEHRNGTLGGMYVFVFVYCNVIGGWNNWFVDQSGTWILIVSCPYPNWRLPYMCKVGLPALASMLEKRWSINSPLPLRLDPWLILQSENYCHLTFRICYFYCYKLFIFLSKSLSEAVLPLTCSHDDVVAGLTLPAVWVTT